MTSGITTLKPDVVLFDFRVPGETTIALRENLAEPNLSLIRMSIWTGEEIVQFTEAFGCAFIDKAELATQLVPAIEAAAHRT